MGMAKGFSEKKNFTPRRQDQCCWLTVAESKLHCHISEFRDGVHVARRAKLGGRDFQSGMAHAAAVMDIYLTNADPHCLVLGAGRVLQCVGWRRFVQKDCVRVIGGSFWKRVGPQNSPHFGSRAHNNPNGLAGIVTQAPFEIGLHSGWRQPALKDAVAARDVSLYARKTGIATHALELRHWKLACPAYIDSAHESNVFGHVSSISLA